MKKIMFFLSLISILFITGCEKSLNIPPIEGTYEYLLESEDGRPLVQSTIIVKKIGKNKYSLGISDYDASQGRITAIQEVEVIAVKKDREKSPQMYKLSVKELTNGSGIYEYQLSRDSEYKVVKLAKVEFRNISDFIFYPESATRPHDKISLGPHFGIDEIYAWVTIGHRVSE